MPMAFGALFKKFWPHLLIVGAIFAALFYVNNLRDTVATQKVTIASLTSERDQVRLNYNGLLTGLDTQREMIQILSDRTDSMKSSVEQLRVGVTTDVANLGTNLGQIINNNMSMLTCDQAIDYLRDRAIVGTKK